MELDLGWVGLGEGLSERLGGWVNGWLGDRTGGVDITTKLHLIGKSDDPG